MRTTQLYIKVGSNWSEIDLFDNVTIPLTYKVTELREFGSKTSGYSLDFDIPHTNNNAQLFGLNQEIDAYDATFEVGKDYEAYVTNNGLTTFNGQFRLKKVFKRHDGKDIYYVGYLYGGAKTFIDELGNTTLRDNDNPADDLDFSDIAVSAADFDLQEFIDRLQNFDTSGTDFGLTLIDKTNKAADPFVGNTQQWYTSEVTPYLPVIAILNKIFSGTSWQYVSEFLGGSGTTYMSDSQWADTIGQFDIYKMIYPYPNHNDQLVKDTPPITLEVSQQINAKGEMYGDELFPSNASLQPYIEFDALTTNPGNYSYSLPQNDQYQVLNWQPRKNGYFNINITMPFKVGLLFAYYWFDPVLGWTQVKYNQSSPKTHAYTYPLETYFTLCTKRNGREIVLADQSITWTLTEGETLTQYASTTWGGLLNAKIFSHTNWTGTFTVSNLQCTLLATDVLYIRVHTYVPFTDNQTPAFYDTTPELGADTRLSGAPRIYTTGQAVGTQIMEFLQISQWGEGQAFDPTVILNPKTKKVDFFNNLVKMFNLYVEDVSNKKNYATGGIYPPNTLRIEPYEMYYRPAIKSGDTNRKDWTDKIDWNTVEYRRVDDYLYSTVRGIFAHDGDHYTAQYNDTYKLPYGENAITGEYCRNDDEQNINVTFGSYMSGLINSSTEVAECPKIFTLNNSGNVDENKQYSGGVFFIYNHSLSHQGLQQQNITIKSQTSATAISINYYWAADTLNDDYGADTAELSFGTNSEYLQQLLNYSPTLNNLFNAFYATQYFEMTAPDARTLRAKAYLTSLDISTLQLSDLIIVKGAAYHVAEILDWKDDKTPCEIELIKCVPPSIITV